MTSIANALRLRPRNFGIISFLPKVDWTLLALIAAVLILGLTVLYSAGYDPEGYALELSYLGITLESRPFVKQLVFLTAGMVPFLLGALIPIRWLYRFAFAYYTLVFISLLAVPFVGSVFNGSRRWLDFGPIHLQPAELMKLGVVLCLARFLSNRLPRIGGYGLLQLIIPVLLVAIPMALTVAQPDLGTGLVIGAIGAAMVLFVGVRWQVLLSAVVIATIAAIPAWHKLHDYQKLRILVLFDPALDPQGSGYHIAQSKIAVGSGGILGKGYLSGTQAHLEFLPEHTTDFIFSVLAEEWGLVGCAIVLSVYLALLLRLLLIASSLRDNFACLVVFGIGFGFFFHTFVNIGMVLGVLPVVGIPLPLFSYGGSSLWSTLFSLGIVFGISTTRTNYMRNNQR